MLAEIKSIVFREKIIEFHSGLNIVIGDENAHTSIGKSNLLLIIDFVFGGDTYINHSLDVIKEMGEHEFYFSFKFDRIYRFKRSTDDDKTVFECNDNYEKIKQISINEFTSFLQKKYKINYVDSTFRVLVGLYLRVWGKYNYDMHKPLKTYKNDHKEKEGIYNLIKLFDKFEKINETIVEIKNDESSKKILTGMYKNEYASKITKTQYEKNELNIKEKASKIEDIQNNILKYLGNPKELINPKVLALLSEKNILIDMKSKYEKKLFRIEKNLETKSGLNKKHLEKLQEFFPNSNIEKIDKIENFHKKIKTILASEIKKSKLEIEDKILLLNEEINILDGRIEYYLGNEESSKKIIKQVYELTLELNELRRTNSTYRETETKTKNIKNNKEKLNSSLEIIVNKIKIDINNEIRNINKKIYDNDTPALINIETSKYSLTKPNDTGTGTSYMNLILFDLAILKLTNLPLLAHDSILFKNVGNDVMEKLIKFYNIHEKQIFISIDEHKKYTEVSDILKNQQVIKLDKEHTLFSKIWNNKV